jgi:hypothetical protein
MNISIFNYVLFKIIGQPDNYKGENCAMMRTHGSAVGELNDAACVIGMQGYICQYSQGIYTLFNGMLAMSIPYFQIKIKSN